MLEPGKQDIVLGMNMLDEVSGKFGDSGIERAPRSAAIFGCVHVVRQVLERL